jgi:hypothetical protein
VHEPVGGGAAEPEQCGGLDEVEHGGQRRIIGAGRAGGCYGVGSLIREGWYYSCVSGSPRSTTVRPESEWAHPESRNPLLDSVGDLVTGEIDEKSQRGHERRGAVGRGVPEGVAEQVSEP